MDLTQNDFNYTILTERAHRPWPMPDSPWVMTQTWHNLLFAHWRVDRQHLRALVPVQLELDLFDGEAWMAIVPFYMTNVAPRAIPALPWLSAFPEMNVRTYVRHKGRGGVFFFSLDASNPLAVRAARVLFHLPYFTAAMKVEDRGSGSISYESRRTDRHGPPATWVAGYAPVSSPSAASPGSLEAFLTERYCLFTVDRRGRTWSVDIHHPPWPLQAAECEIQTNTMASAARIALPGDAPLLHFSRRQDMVGWLLRIE